MIGNNIVLGNTAVVTPEPPGQIDNLTMAAENVHKQEFNIRNLSTRSVILYPTRAQIIRDVKEITLQPGPNQIVIDGLAPTVDEHSIKVEGTGSATITDVSVDLLPNRELFEDIYPSDDDDDDEETDDEHDSEAEQEAMIEVVNKIKDLNVRLLAEQETINSAATRLIISDYFGKGTVKDRPPPSDLGKLVEAYKEERQKIYRDHENSTAASEKIREQITKAEKQKAKLAKEWVKANEKKKKEEAKAKEKKLRKQAEVDKEKERVRLDRESFWPKKTYRVTINLESSTFTPSSSRRSSMDGATVVNLATSTFHEESDKELKSDTISLSLSYITHSASWSPRYDLSLNTVKCSGLLEYGAELKNTTSETWRDAKIILSTSQTNFSGLSETIPIMQPWHVRLLKGANRNSDSALFSQHEIQAKQIEWSQTAEQAERPRFELFGRDTTSGALFQAKRTARQEEKQGDLKNRIGKYMSQFDEGPAVQAFGSSGEKAHVGRRMFASPAARGGIVFGGAPDPQNNDPQSLMYTETKMQEECKEEEDHMDFGLFHGPNDPAPNSLTFEAGAWEESGMSTSYDVPGTKTLIPSNSAIKHKIAKIEFKNVIFSHIVIGKLRQVAFLKARMRNNSKITLLKGPLGLTLDGSFLGQTKFPRCSAGESFSLPLGVDPSLNVTYPKPIVRRSQSGIFSKEDSNIFSRTLVIMNTKPNASCELTVLDQIPVSEDERLRIEITSPNGLKPGGQSVRTGVDAAVPRVGAGGGKDKGTAKDARGSVYGSSGEAANGKWGTAIATAKKGGEVVWNVKLNPGHGVKLTLEYECTFPGGENIHSVAGAVTSGNPRLFG
ncbi:hypothetical protein BJ875DRAFT_426897 [Amylocarpus encephaloides]|uniref:DUF4139 domain-containing protein n=1 Tax=Amylocarpus encephaloides TaxID=45428 RepID=A0A9P7YH30_9HELO|nr:hypothetical protein BJ875DRAFT_426897 [Amylocarpus encephaloides]